MSWTDYEAEDHIPFDPDDFVLNIFHNIITNQKYQEDHNPKQVPFSRGVPGPASLRGRTEPYKVTT